MDTVLAIVRRLSAAGFLLLVLACGFAPKAAHAGLYPTDPAVAKQNCEKYMGAPGFIVGGTWWCYPAGPVPVGGDQKPRYYYQGAYTQGGVTHCCDTNKRFFYDGPPAASPCTDANAGGGLGPGGYAGKITSGMTWCKAGVPDPGTPGATVSCTAKFTPSGPPTMNQWGSWHTPGTLSITGEFCDGSGGGGWKNPSGQPPSDPVPPAPTAEPPKNPPPKACGGGSCYDPNNDNFCAVSGSGKQFCIPGNIARQPGGGCASSGDSTLCAGSPSAPSPPASQVPDPPTAVRSNDSYTQADPATGGNQNVTVINYTNQGAPPATSGQQTGDSGPPASGGDPASGSSTSSNPGSYSGGGDCGSPPVCTGDAVMCGVARQQWTAMCQAKKDAAQLHTDLTGTGAPTDLDALKGKYGQADVWSDSDTSQDSTVGGQANNGTYDTSGFGYGTACPLKDISVSLGSRGTFVIPLQDKCMVGDWLRALVLGFALFSAAIITAGGRGS